MTGYDPTLDGGFRIGGDTIKVCNLANLDDSVRTVDGRADSPLVVYGDTSQDGVWYGGHPYDALGMEFGPKPFDPFTKIPDAQNEDDEWVFALGDPFDLRRQRHHRREQPLRGHHLQRGLATCRPSASRPTAAPATT